MAHSTQSPTGPVACEATQKMVGENGFPALGVGFCAVMPIPRGVGEKCCGEVLEKRVVEKCWRRIFLQCVGEECWRRVLAKRVVENWCREVQFKGTCRNFHEIPSSTVSSVKMAQRPRFHGSSSARRVMRLLRGGLADETIIKAYAKLHRPKLTDSEKLERQTDLREIRAATHDTFIQSSKAMRWNHVVYVDDHGLVLQKMVTGSSGSQVLLKKATNWKQQSSCCSCS